MSLNPKLGLLRIVWLILILIAVGCSRQKSISDQGNSPLFIDETKLKPGDVIKPFAYIDPDKHDWRVEIRISGEDLLDLGKRKMHSRKFSTDEPALLNRIREWEFTFGKKSTQRATSTFRVYRDNQLVDKHGLVLEKRASLGYQSTKYGLLEPVDQEDMFKLINEMSNF